MNVLYTGLAGLQRAEAKVESTSSRIAQFPFSINGSPEDVVDISAEAVALLSAEAEFAVNLKVAEAGNELEKSVIDLFG